jgi:hypothetical protein
MPSEGRAVPISLEALRQQLLFAIEADARAIEAWLHGTAEPDFIEIADRALPALEVLIEREWIHLSGGWRERVRETMILASRPAPRGFRGPVAEVVAIVRWALRPTLPRPPLAAQMALTEER